MRILGIKIGMSYFGNQHRRKVTSKLERITNAALLDIALRDPAVLTSVLDKYGKIETYHDDVEMEAKINNIRTKIHKEAVQTILNTRSQELASRIDGIIDQLMGTSDRSSKQQKEVSIAETITNELNGVQAVNRQRHTMESGSMHSLNLSTFLKNLEMPALLGKLAGQGIQMKGRANAGKTYTVESKRRTVEMDKYEYRNYLCQRKRRLRKEGSGHHQYMARQPRFTGTTEPVPVPPEENEE